LEDIQKLYELYSVDIYKFILSLSKDTYIAEDVMQSTFLSAIKSLDTFKGNSSVKTWLIGIAKNEYYTYRRKNPLNNSLEDVGANNFIYKEEYNHNYNTVINEISKLDETNKEIAILRLINDLTFKEIGVITGKSENYCRVSFFRIKKKLWEVLKDE
jgi:RNA polymerase sigma-70 factor (ECF subfamily)